jgi:hypothetical protein
VNAKYYEGQAAQAGTHFGAQSIASCIQSASINLKTVAAQKHDAAPPARQLLNRLKRIGFAGRKLGFPQPLALPRIAKQTAIIFHNNINYY